MASVSNKQTALQRRLTQYSCAAGAGMLASGAIAGALPTVPPMPVEGLPISIDSSVLIGDPLLIDIDSNGEDDFQIYYTSEYGGGFAVSRVTPVSEVGYPMIQHHFQYIGSDGTYVATRNDLTEYIPVNNENYFPSQIYYMYAGGPAYIDRNLSAELPAYTPFRNHPGFLGLVLGTANTSVGHAATLKVSLNGNGTQLTVHSGWYRDDEYDLYLDDGILHSSGFEAYPQSEYFPALALPALAEGDTGESHD